MTEEEKALTRKCLDAWRQAAPVLEQMRREDIRNADTVKAMQLLDDAFDAAVWMTPPRETSGLVELQRILMRSRR